MKKIHLTHFVQTARAAYEVKLGNGSIFQFSSEKRTKKFLVEVSQTLTAHLVQLNELFVEINSIYRRTWFMMDRHPVPGRNSHQIKREVKASLDSIDHAFERLLFVQYSPDYNSLSFGFLFKACNHIKNAVMILKEFDNSKSYTVNKYRFQSLINHASFIESELRNYKIAKAFRFDTDFKIEYPANLIPAAL